LHNFIQDSFCKDAVLAELVTFYNQKLKAFSPMRRWC